VPARLLDDDVIAAKTQMRPLDIEADIERYGPETVGGVSAGATAGSSSSATEFMQ
jgi:hypothetical protein